MSKEKPEAPIQKGCLAILKERGIFAWRNNTTGVYDPIARRFRTFNGLLGVSDILAIFMGRFIAIECKAPAIPKIKQSAGSCSKEQTEFLTNVRANGGVGLVIYDPDRLRAALDILADDPWADLNFYGYRDDYDTDDSETDQDSASGI